jgi:hypothetical protein
MGNGIAAELDVRAGGINSSFWIGGGWGMG